MENDENGPVSSLIYPWNMVIFHGYVNVYQRVKPRKCFPGVPSKMERCDWNFSWWTCWSFNSIRLKSSSLGEGISESAAVQDQQADLLFYAANEVVMALRALRVEKSEKSEKSTWGWPDVLSFVMVHMEDLVTFHRLGTIL